jgi:hypothetical protein
MNEEVLLTREPENEYDKYAIRVDNLRGEKLGYIRAASGSVNVAGILSPLIDEGRLLDLKGCALAYRPRLLNPKTRGKKNSSKLPLLLSVSIPLDSMGVVEEVLRKNGIRLVAEM